ncbi:phage tail assembly protein [Azospirillum tabaci]|uniref:phage tail assembly protein n=1 Tax=Azospirillum tabaci TaxID=2752310 RepID=UPI001660AEE1|nr:phage tail assembly protein [Azospirillum tabaci]
MSTVTLKKPIQAHGEEVRTLTFREPNCEDIMVCGYPLQMSGDGSFTPLAGVIVKYISRLAAVPPSSVKAMTAQDFNACMATIIPFFGDGDQSQSPADEG